MMVVSPLLTGAGWLCSLTVCILAVDGSIVCRPLVEEGRQEFGRPHHTAGAGCRCQPFKCGYHSKLLLAEEPAWEYYA